VSPPLLDEVLEAYGGADRWRSTTAIRARVRTGGLLLATRAPRELVASYRLEMRLDRQLVELAPDAVSERMVFDDGTVRLTDADGGLVEERRDARRCFFGRAGLRRNVRWDPLDLGYFAGYAMWNYLATPILLTREGVEVTEGPGRRLDATFPEGLHTHSRRQTFWFDADSLLRRHDYTADVVGRWARAAHAVHDHREFGGLLFPTRRRVTPRGPGSRVLPRPVLVWIALDEIETQGG
jgi:hypothetical protein